MKRFVPVTLGVAVVVGLTGGVAAAAEWERGPSAAALAARARPLVTGTPCTATAAACVDLESQRAWLLREGKVMRGPVPISSGGNGQETPVGHSLRVYRKEADHRSGESRLPDGRPAPMPWSVFFEDGGIAFHGGSPQRSSAGCIHLEPADAKAWFDRLRIGDQVQVVKASEEKAARAAGSGGKRPSDGRSGADDRSVGRDDGDGRDGGDGGDRDEPDGRGGSGDGGGSGADDE